MEKKQYELCFQVLKKLNKAGILQHIVIVGSWSFYFYEYYFKGINFIPTIRTRDIDFVVPIPDKIKSQVNVPEILKDLGFIVQHGRSSGHIRLSHPELIIEFLVPEKGRGNDKPYKLPNLGLNAQALRFLDFLLDNTIKIKVEGLNLYIPHPAALALHKIIISERRIEEEKKEKDIAQANYLLKILIKNGEKFRIRRIFGLMLPKWQKRILSILKNQDNNEVISILK